jgi:uncharacterized membrane protein
MKTERQGLAGRRLALAMVVGAAVFVAALAAGGGWTVALSGGWGAAAFVIFTSIWLRTRSMDAAETAKHAQAEDYSRQTADLIVLSASVASLVSIGFALVEARHKSGTGKGLLIALAVAVVAVSWLAVHFVYVVRYGD